MSKRRFRFRNSTLKNRMKKNKPVWLWKWTADAHQEYKKNKWKLNQRGAGLAR